MHQHKQVSEPNTFYSEFICFIKGGYTVKFAVTLMQINAMIVNARF